MGLALHVWVYSFVWFLCLIVFSLFFFASIYLLIIKLFCLCDLQQIAKKRKFEISDNYLFKSHLWYEWLNFRKVFFISMLRFKLLNFLWVCDRNKLVLLCDDSILLTYDIIKNEISWKSWLNPRFLRNFKSKWALKWLPLDRGYFKFYFHKGKSILIILCRTYLWTLEFVILF